MSFLRYCHLYLPSCKNANKNDISAWMAGDKECEINDSNIVTLVSEGMMTTNQKKF